MATATESQKSVNLTSELSSLNRDEVVEEWNSLIREWMISKNQVSACGLASIKDGAIFAGACLEGDPVNILYRPSYQVPMIQEDGSELMTNIEEPYILKQAAEQLKAPNGLWVGGQKYRIVRSEQACDQGEFVFKTIFCAKPKGGCCVVITPKGMIVIAIYSEELNQQGATAKAAALAFAEFLAKNDY